VADRDPDDRGGGLVTVTQDAYSRKYCPATSAEWTELLSGLSINNPSSWWLCQETSGNLADSGPGARPVTVSGGPAYFQTANGWARKGIKPTDGSATMYGIATIPNVNANSSMLLQMFSLNTVAAGSRALCRIGQSDTITTLQVSNKLRGTRGANTSDGSLQNTGTLIVLTKLDRANSVYGVYTRHEQIKPTWGLPGASTDLYVLGNAGAASDATLVYAAYWTGSDAEIADSKIATLFTALYGGETTLAKMQTGSFAMKWVATIEGCPYIFSDAPAAAVVAAYAGTDWTSTSQVLGGLFVELDNTQSITPLKPFTSTGGCKLRIMDADRADTFGTFVARRQGGRESTITNSLGTNETTINVRSTNAWPSSGIAYIGTEAVAYTGVGASSLTGVTRGMYSPFRPAQSGSGGNRFGNPHRVGTDINHVQMNPVISTIPRVWIGKRVCVRLHTWDAANQAINSMAEAQKVFPGRIAGIAEDRNVVGTVVINCDHLMNDLEDAVIWRDQFTADLKPGIALIAGRTFTFADTGAAGAQALTVVSGAPASTNQVKEGTYSLSELCAVINAWLGGEKAAARINGYYSFASPVSNAEGMRTRVNWYNDAAVSSVPWSMSVPSEVASFHGFTDGDPTNGGTQVIFGDEGVGRDALQNVTSGSSVPFESLIFRPLAARLGLEFSGSAYIDADNVTGTFVDNYASLPASIKSSCSSTAQWGVFLFDEKVLVAGTYDPSTQRLRNLWAVPVPLSGSNDTSPASYFGRRADEPDRGPIKVRQLLWHEGSRASLFLKLLYSTGTAGYNHGTYDSFTNGVGVGIPGELISDEFEASVWNLAGSEAPRTLWLDEPKKFSDLIAGELALGLAFVRWKDQHFELSQWRTPLNANAIATLSESNKAAPASEAKPNHRVASEETNEHVRPVIKFDYCRDQAIGRNGDFLRSFMFEDQTSVDDAGQGVRPVTIKLPNVLQQHANAGASVEAALPDFMARMPSISRSSRKIERTIDHRYIEVIAPGDVVTVTDRAARDPLTGARGVNSRAAFVTSAFGDYGGPSPVPGGEPREPSADVVVNFLDTQRGRAYAPSADIDETANSGGFTSGYNVGTKTVRCHANHYSHVITFQRARGTVYLSEAADASRLVAGDKVNVIERDPANTAAPLTWSDTVLTTPVGNDVPLTTGLAGFDTTKRYRIVPQKYSQVQTTQREAAYQADDADEWVEDMEIPWHFSASDELYDFTDNTPDAPAELVPDMCYGDGRPWDVGHDQAIARFLNAFIDRKSAHQAPFLQATMGPVDTASTTWATFFFGPIFLGTEHLSATVTRSLTVAPWFRSSSAGNTGKVRVTIMDMPPAMAFNPGNLPGECFRDSLIPGKVSRTAEYSTTSATWQQGADAALSLGVKDIFFGFVWVLVEGTGFVECRGLAKCVEGPRQVL